MLLKGIFEPWWQPAHYLDNLLWFDQFPGEHTTPLLVEAYSLVLSCEHVDQFRRQRQQDKPHFLPLIDDTAKFYAFLTFEKVWSALGMEGGLA